MFGGCLLRFGSGGFIVIGELLRYCVEVGFMFCVNVCSLIYWFGYPIVCCFVVGRDCLVVLVWLIVVAYVCVLHC